MPDITMCANHFCGKRHECYRYMAKPGYWQSYADFEGDEDGCAHFYPIFTAPTITRDIQNENDRSRSGNNR